MIENISRQDALSQIIYACSHQKFDDNIKDLILLFGFSGEELLENGAKYEDVMSLKAILK